MNLKKSFKRNPEWLEYQKKASSFFRSLGLKSRVNVSVEGARGKHALDVYVEFERFGIKTVWAVECKAWKSNIPKEKIAAFSAIVQDVGADRGFFLSEVGFQSGAILLAKKTNITLASLKELKTKAKDDILLVALSALRKRLFDLQQQVHSFYAVKNCGPNRRSSSAKPGVDIQNYFFYVAQLGILESGFEKAEMGRFPAPYAFDKKKDKPLFVKSLKEIVALGSKQIRYCEKWARLQEKAITRVLNGTGHPSNIMEI